MEQSEAKNLTERLNWLGSKICEDAPQLCVEFAADVGHFITQEAIDRAEGFSKDRFDRISGELVEEVRSIVNPRRATRLSFTLSRPIQRPGME